MVINSGHRVRVGQDVLGVVNIYSYSIMKIHVSGVTQFDQSMTQRML